MARHALRPSVLTIPRSTVLVLVLERDGRELGFEALRGAELDLRRESRLALATRAVDGTGKLHTLRTIVQSAAMRATELATAMMAISVPRPMPEEEEPSLSLAEETVDEAAEEVLVEVPEVTGSVTVSGTTVVPALVLAEVVAATDAEVVAAATGEEVGLTAALDESPSDVPATPLPVVPTTGADVPATGAVVPAAAAVVSAAATVEFAWRFTRSSMRRSMSSLWRGRSPAS